MNTKGTTASSKEEFKALLQQIDSPQARELITWVLQRLTGPDAGVWAALFKKVFKVWRA